MRPSTHVKMAGLGASPGSPGSPAPIGGIGGMGGMSGMGGMGSTGLLGGSANISLQHVEEAVLGILQGSPYMAEYNQFMVSFVETEAAWEISMRLCLTSTNMDVQYFGINLLYTKVSIWRFNFVRTRIFISSHYVGRSDATGPN
jgi:hypothetical protein